jgi:hypothetical protein
MDSLNSFKKMLFLVKSLWERTEKDIFFLENLEKLKDLERE